MNKLPLVLVLLLFGCTPPAPITLPPERVVCPPVAPEGTCPPLPPYLGRDFTDVWADVQIMRGVCSESLNVWRDSHRVCQED